MVEDSSIFKWLEIRSLIDKNSVRKENLGKTLNLSCQL